MRKSQNYLVLAFASALALSSVFALASALAFGRFDAAWRSFCTLIMTLSPFLISPVALVSLSRAISQLSAALFDNDNVVFDVDDGPRHLVILRRD